MMMTMMMMMMMRMMLPAGPRSSGRVPLSVCVSACACACWLLFTGGCASSPVRSRCQRLTCANEGRHFCKAGSSHCGACLSPLVENKEGHCVEHKHKQHHRGHETVPELEEEIDFLHSVIETQEVTVVRPKPPVVQVNTSSQNDKIFFDAVVPNQSSRIAADPPSVTNTPGSPPPPSPPAPQGSGTPAPPPGATTGDSRAAPLGVPAPIHLDDKLIIIMIGVCVAVSTVFIIVTAVCFFRLRKGSHLAKTVEYPAFRGPGPSLTVSGASQGDKNLAQSAQMYHYQHQKQQMMSMGKHEPEQKVTDPEVSSDEEETGGGIKVYECPGLAPTGEMEVKNPLFDDSKLQYQWTHE